MFQLFSLIVDGLNVGKQLKLIRSYGMVSIPNLIDPAKVAAVRERVRAVERGVDVLRAAARSAHDARVHELLAAVPEAVTLAANPIILQIIRRCLSPGVVCSAARAVATSPRAVRMDLDAVAWEVPPPFSHTEWPPPTDELNARLVLLLDDLDKNTSTWAYAPPQSSLPSAGLQPEGTPLHGAAGSAFLFVGGWWLTNTAGAGSFWKEADAMARYKHMNGNGEPKEEPVRVVVIDYVREYVAREEKMDAAALRAAADNVDDIAGAYPLF